MTDGDRDRVGVTKRSPLVIQSFEIASHVVRSDDFGAPATPEARAAFVAGSVLHLNGDAHHRLRKLEAPLFAKAAVLAYERGTLLAACERQIRIARAGQSANLVEIARRIMLELAARLIGLDGLDEPTRLDTLERCMYPLTEAVEYAMPGSDIDEVVANGSRAKTVFVREFIEPAVRERVTDGREPKDLIGLLAASDEYDSDPDFVARESIVFLAGATLSTSTAIVSTILELERWFLQHPGERRRLEDDAFLHAATNEALRLQPTAPYLPKTALVDVVLPDGRPVGAGETVLIDRAAIHRDASVFGEAADRFDPFRAPRDRIPPYGLAFGGGRHLCSGRPLVTDARPPGPGDPQRGIPIVVRSLYAHGMTLDASRETLRSDRTLHRFDLVPVVFSSPA